MKKKLIFIRYLFYRYVFSLNFNAARIHKSTNLKKVMESINSTFFGYFNFVITNANGNLIFLEQNQNQKHINIVLKKDDKCIKLGETLSWNYQQGCMLIWFDEDKSKIIFNDYSSETNLYYSRVIDFDGNRLMKYSRPIQAVAVKSRIGLSINYERLSVLRPEYGYTNKTDIVLDDENDGLWKFCLNNSFQEKLIIDLNSLKKREKNFQNIQKQKINHVLFNEKEDLFVFLYRFELNETRFHRLYLSDINGDFRLLSANMVSHYCWLDNENLIFFGENVILELGYYRINVNSREINLISDKLPKVDGHPVVIYNRYIVFDTYPGLNRFSGLFIYDIEKDLIVNIGSFFQSFDFIGGKRVDLHPKLSFDLNKCFIESSHNNNTRTLYEIDISKLVNNE